MAQRYECRVAGPEELGDILAPSACSAAFELVLKPRFRSVEHFIAEMRNAGNCVAFCCAVADSAALGWACCFKFHERSGYAGVVQLAMDLPPTEIAASLGGELYRMCETQCLQFGVHTIVSFAHSRVPELIRWHHVNAFSACGDIDIGQAEKLHVYCRKIG